MNTLFSYDREVTSIFQLLGDKENDITLSIAWALARCPSFAERLVNHLFNNQVEGLGSATITTQQFDRKTGITDIELMDDKKQQLYVIFEAKRGWVLPGTDQLTRYSQRKDFRDSPARHKAIATMSECSEEFAVRNLPFQVVNQIPVLHISWKSVYSIAEQSKASSNNEQKHLLEELCEYLRGIMTMQSQTSNWVYVVALGSGKPGDGDISWIDIVTKRQRYFHPVGGNGWPKEPPNYIAFRYWGKLQSIHHIESYTISKNLHIEIPEMDDYEGTNYHFIYRLGPAISPSKVVRTGKIFRNGRVWAMLDTLLTADTISDARDLSRSRMSEKGIPQGEVIETDVLRADQLVGLVSSDVDGEVARDERLSLQ